MNWLCEEAVFEKKIVMSTRVWLLLLLSASLTMFCQTTVRQPPIAGPGPKPAGAPPANPIPAAAPSPPSDTTPVPSTTPRPTAVPAGVSAALGSPPPAASVPEQPAPPAAAGTRRPYQDILTLKQSGASDEVLLEKVRADNVNYQLTTSEIIELRDAGVPPDVMKAMLRSGQH
jgi:hypothetical protein